MNEFSHQTITETIFGREDHLFEYCLLPDLDEKQRVYSSHFYNPVTRLCYRQSEDSARNRLIYWTGQYLISNNPTHLGRAIHYLEDICTPVHTQYQDSFDAVYRANIHVEFEKMLDKYIKEHGVKSSEKMDVRSLTDLVNVASLQSSQTYYKYKDFSVFEESFQSTVELAISSLLAFNDILKKLESKIIPYHDSEIMVVKSDNEFLVACLDFNTSLRTNDKHQIYVFTRPSEIKNYKFKEIIDEF